MATKLICADEVSLAFDGTLGVVVAVCWKLWPNWKVFRAARGRPFRPFPNPGTDPSSTPNPPKTEA